MKKYISITALLLLLTVVGSLISYASSITNDTSLPPSSQPGNVSPAPSVVSQSIVNSSFTAESHSISVSQSLSVPQSAPSIPASSLESSSVTSESNSLPDSKTEDVDNSNISSILSTSIPSDTSTASTIEPTLEPQQEELPTTINLPVIASPPPSAFTDTIYYNATNPLGIAGSFHLVAFNSITMNAHTNGNVLVNSLYANANFGTNNLEDELSYIVNYNTINSGSATSDKHILVVGNTNNVSLVDNGNAIAINDRKLDRPKTVWQDTDTQFIDLSAVRVQVQELSTELKSYPNSNITANLNPIGGSVNESYIALTDAAASGVFNTTATELSSLKYLGIQGFSSANRNSVIINIDCEGAANIQLPTSLITIDNNQIGCSETTTFTNGRVLWNFYNVLPSSGTTITASLLHGSVMAEGANVVATQNLNGTVIAENIDIRAESHRDDFIGTLPNPKTTISVTVSKAWLTSTGSDLDSTSYSAVIHLMRDGVKFGEPVTLNEGNNFSHVYTELDVDYSYTIEEISAYYHTDDVTDSFTTTILQSNSQTITITNRQKGNVPITLPATGGNQYIILIIGFLLTFISASLIYNYRRTR